MAAQISGRFYKFSLLTLIETGIPMKFCLRLLCLFCCWPEPTDTFRRIIFGCSYGEPHADYHTRVIFYI